MKHFVAGRSITLPITPHVGDLNAIQIQVAYRSNAASGGPPSVVTIIRLVKTLVHESEGRSDTIIVSPIGHPAYEQQTPVNWTQFRPIGLKHWGQRMANEVESRTGSDWDAVLTVARQHDVNIVAVGYIEPILVDNLHGVYDDEE